MPRKERLAQQPRGAKRVDAPQDGRAVARIVLVLVHIPHVGGDVEVGCFLALFELAGGGEGD